MYMLWGWGSNHRGRISRERDKQIVFSKLSDDILSVWLTEQNGACVLTLTMGEVLWGSPDIEPSLGAVMDSLRDPLASPHPPTNDTQVAEVARWWQ